MIVPIRYVDFTCWSCVAEATQALDVHVTDSHPHPARPGSGPAVVLQAPDDETVTSYDQQHFLTYARMLDAETGGFDWRESAAAILGLDVERDVLAAQACWKSHLARAHWIATTGYRLLLIEAGLSEGE